MTPRDNLEHYEATEAQDLTRLLRALRPPERDVQVPPPVDLAIRAAIWQASVRRQLSTLLSMARRDLVQVIRQALLDNPLLEEVVRPEEEGAPAGGAHIPDLTEAAEDLTAAVERYDSVWQACVPDGRDAHGLPAPASEAPSASEQPSDSPDVLVPDVIVTPVGQEYQVVLNEDGMPRLRLRATSRAWVREGQGGQPEATQDLDDNLRAAVWLIRSLEYRRRTLSAVAQSLVTRQRAFLDHGPAHLQPLALTEVAEALGLHASTVRRVVTNTYLATAHGVVALTSYFRSSVESSGGKTMSSLTVRDRITQLVAAEDPAQPLTDQQLVEMLAAEHINIARRTVTQYRRELQLPPAHRRQPHGSTVGASRLPPDEEQRVRQALEAHARRRQAEPPSERDREEASEIPPEREEPRRRRDDEAAASPHQWFEKISGEVRAARRDLQTALAHPQLRPAVLLALRAFAQAAQAGAPPAPPADALAFPFVELGPTPRPGPDAEAPSPAHDLNTLMRQAIRRVGALLEVEGVAVILLDEARQELYFKVADPPRPGHEPQLREVRFPATQGIAGWVVRESRSLIVPDVDQEPRFYRGVDSRAGTRTRSLLCVPLRTQGRILGVLEAINKRQGVFTADDVRRLEAFAEQFAPAVEHARGVQARYALEVQQLIAEAERLANSPVLFDTLIRESPKMKDLIRQALEQAHQWPGNVRELEEVIEGAVARGQGPTVSVQDLPQALREHSRAPGSGGEAFRLPPGGINMSELEKRLIRQVLELTHHNKSQAAKFLGLSRTQLRARMRLHGLE